tara:strand:- start:1682 stop:2806 length:1125 start_codon:yes stop_codon:yes gene_type:complete
MANIASFALRYSRHNFLAILSVFIFLAGTVSSILLIINTPNTLKASQSHNAHNLKKDASERIYIVPQGSTSRKIGEELVTFGYVRSGLQFELLIDLMGIEGILAAAPHELARNISPSQLAALLTVQPSIPGLVITFPEGLRFEEMATIVEDSGFAKADDFLTAIENSKVPEEFKASFPENTTLQGYLFPDTYEIALDATPEDLVKLMLDTLILRFSTDIILTATKNNLNTHEVLTLASIIEREAVLPSERKMISSVFHNRLRDGTTLGADPTVQYAIAEIIPDSVEIWGWWKPGYEITITDLEIDSPYNTRIYPGLPPGPISNPGLASIIAAVEPDKTDYYFFVRDVCADDNSHLFAITLEEHRTNLSRNEKCQ